MKRLHYFLFAIVLFMSFTTGVEANTKCVYDWNDIRFVLETDEGGSTLNKVTTNPDYDFDLYQGGISLNRGACPRISIIDTSILFGFSSWRRIYPTREACVEDNGNRGNEECSQLVGGTRSLNDESTESLLGLEGQFDLVGSSANTCNYSYESTDVNIDLDITKDGNSLRYICHSDQTDTCNPTANDEVENAILNNGNFTCPPYLYASNIKVTGIISTNFDLTGVGTEDDENTS